MQFDTTLLTPDMRDMPAHTQAAEALGFDGLWVSETKSDPFLSLALASEHSRRMTLGTGIAVAFPRSPAILAMTAWDLARYSNGRFILGLGTQVKAHNERRLGVAWDKPVRRLRETIEAIRVFWETWQYGAPFFYEGEFFKLTLMTPFFAPPPLESNLPHIYIAAVNEQMLRLAGKSCDGVLLHALHTRRYITDYALPHIRAGLNEAGRSLVDIAIASNVFAIPTDDAKPAAEHEQYAKQQIAFYLSTPAYRVIAELHDWRETAVQLSRLARGGDWAAMTRLIDDNILSEFALTGTWADIGRQTRHKYGGLLDRIGYYLPFEPGVNDDGWRATLHAFRTAAQEPTA